MKEDLCVVFSFLYNIFIGTFSIFLCGIFILTLDASNGGMNFAEFKLYSNIFLIFIGIYIAYIHISKQYYSIISFSLTYVWWIEVFFAYFFSYKSHNIYSTTIVLYNCLFYTFLLIKFCAIKKRKKSICS